ncbi:MAG TPA: response regulator [Polyangiaceae bacterium]
MPKTLLAVDDSATMRKVLEITFAGEDFRVVTADGPAGALARMAEEPSAVVIDTSLTEGDGYGLAKEIRARDPRAAILLMASRYAPYDANRGRDSGVDDFIDKPFDTQALIDKLKKAIVARDTGRTAPGPSLSASPAPPPVAAAPAHAAPAAPVVQPPAAFTNTSPRPPVVSPPGARPHFPTQRTHTLSFEGSPHPPPVSAPPAHPVPPISRTAPSGVPVVHSPAPAPAAPPPVVAPTAPSIQRTPEMIQQMHAPRAAAPVVTGADAPISAATVSGAAVNGHLAGKLGDLGLNPAQVEAVLALSREVVERVVWEVVPQLAETMIKEEIARLTKD